MLVSEVKDIARRWVAEEPAVLPGFRGAFHTGSINWLPDGAEFPYTSDADIAVVFDGEPPPSPGKLLYRDVLLEAGYYPMTQFASAEELLGNHQRALFAVATIIADPSGKLAELQASVARDYAKRRWVRTRCESARDHSLNYVRALNEATDFHDQVACWLFAAGVTPHVLLVAGLRNPTVRLRYPAARELLTEYGRLDFYEPLLDLLGCVDMTVDRAAHHLDALSAAFEEAKAVLKTPVFFAADISDHGRRVAIDGSRELIERGEHREAVFWLVATYARCQRVLFHDAPVAMQERHTPGFRDLLDDLGVASYDDLKQRGAQVEALLPDVWDVAEAIMAANHAIED
ncbi:MAG: hypothetical protein WD939_04520 [Dehalococcoidia bacterium]